MLNQFYLYFCFILSFLLKTFERNFPSFSIFFCLRYAIFRISNFKSFHERSPQAYPGSRNRGKGSLALNRRISICFSFLSTKSLQTEMQLKTTLLNMNLYFWTCQFIFTCFVFSPVLAVWFILCPINVVQVYS